MGEKKEYIERGAFLRKCAEAWGHYGVTIKAIEGIADECTAADVVEVVRCKDCVYFKQSVSPLCPQATAFICDFPYGLQRNVSENDFCCHGERKEQT